MPFQATHSADDGVLDHGPHRQGPERLCVATRTVQSIADLIRFVVAPDGEVVPDIKGKLPSRGVWVTGTQSTLEDAIKRKAFARGFKRDVRVSVDLVARTERLLQRAVLDALAMAAKAGSVAPGFSKAAAALEGNDAVALLHAADASPDGIRKLGAIIRRQGHMSLPVIEFLGSAQLDLALSSPNVVHAALLAGAASGAFLSRARRLERYRTGGAGDRGNQTGESAVH
jgi:predicted RNA-binding protein YlxR (DUF448 family)